MTDEGVLNDKRRQNASIVILSKPVGCVKRISCRGNHPSSA